MALTPMMEQYRKMKDVYSGYLLFYRLGDFYEMFFEDAVTVSRELELTLTARDCGEAERAPMCGVPYHAVEGYLLKLVNKGYRVAVCEQMEDPALSKGLVKREVTRIVTPGTVIETDGAKALKNNYLAAVCVDEASASVGVAFIDISTGVINATSLNGADYLERLLTELSVYAPSEILLNLDGDRLPKLSRFTADKLSAVLNSGERDRFDSVKCREMIQEKFSSHLEISNSPECLIRSAGALLDYLYETQKTELLSVTGIVVYDKSAFLEIDAATRRNLEITENMRTGEKRGSLLSVIDRTKSAKGARTLRAWLEKPLLDCSLILSKQKAVGEFISRVIERSEITALLTGICDIDKLTAKAAYHSANVRDFLRLAETLAKLPDIKTNLEVFESRVIASLRGNLDALTDIHDKIESAIDPDSVNLKNTDSTGFVKSGYSSEIDDLRKIVSDSENFIKSIEADERDKTGIKTLKVHYNRVFGYYIEVSKGATGSVPDRYVRKQTLVNCERYITSELKELEEKILTAGERLETLESAVFSEVNDIISTNIARFQATSNALAEIDAYISLAVVAEKGAYVCPEVDTSSIIDIKDGRHPVVEAVNESLGQYYVPNSVLLDCDNNRLLIITGPNMAGKSTFMRQTAIITLLAQIGSFVPAAYARIGVADKIFTRVGASDDLAAGQSTFMVEMSEVANILKYATKRSLIIYDEIGRGTSTFDGMSIARAVLEYTAGKKLGARTLFATHYHEIASLEGEVAGVKNFHIAAKKRDGGITFLRKILPGAADDSFGIEVAALAGVPNEVVKRAKAILSELEENSGFAQPRQMKFSSDIIPDSISFDDLLGNEVAERLRMVNINTVSPLEAFNLLYELIKMVN
ncbi:DNA mismatch repair protein MutS [Clostridia bacterium]|nr:DNA mismatch repair protein MutS [Clostridia bacterium]